MQLVPLISVITVTKNDRLGLQRTFHSVCLQNGCQFEYIVVDGGSCDGTPELLKEVKISALVDRWVSEPDAGLYDAMNKGSKMAKGQWLLFMNSGDEFYESQSLSRCADILSRTENSQCVIGAVEYVYLGGGKKIELPRAVDLRWGMRFCHQATAIRRTYQLENPYVLDDQTAADYGFFVRAVQQQATFLLVDNVIARFYVDGISSKNYPKNVLQEKTLYEKYMGRGSHIFMWRWVYCQAARVAKFFFPLAIVRRIQGVK